MNNKKLILLFSIAALMFSCKSMKKSADATETLSPEAISYSNTVQSIINKNCSGCHSGNKPAAGVLLTSFEEVKKHAKSGKIQHRMNDKNDPMPPKGLLSESARKAIDNWAKYGYK